MTLDSGPGGRPAAAKYEVSEKICHQLETYSSAATTSPASRPAASRYTSSAATLTTASSRYTAGSRRLARRIQNWRSDTVPVPSRSSTISDVIRKPETTKNTSTPRNPPGSHVKSAW